MAAARTKVPSPAALTAAVDELLVALGSSRAGLAAEEAARRLGDHGPNEPTSVVLRFRLRELMRASWNPLATILLVASGASAALGQVTDALIIVTIVTLSSALNGRQRARSDRAMRALRKRVAPTATVVRDGAAREVPRSEVVPGDVVHLAAGDLVPADARLLSSRDLHVQQAALTGESLPVEKAGTEAAISRLDPLAAVGPDEAAFVFLGTSVVSGTATAVVFATGRDTEFGDVVARLAEHPPETELERGLRHYGLLVLRVVTFLVPFVLVVSLWQRRDPLESLLFAVALAVGLTPEFLPMITAVTLSEGALRLARQQVIVKHLSAIQNLGGIDVLCSDKTGTLTRGEMTVESSVAPTGAPTPRPLELAHLNSRFETGIESPLDAAILAQPVTSGDGWEKTDEVPFDFERRRLTVVARRGSTLLLVTKGAPESVLSVCTRAELPGGEGGAAVTVPLDDALRARAEETVARLGAEGFRLIAVAFRDVDRPLGWSTENETDLVLAGFVAFSDPVLDTARESIARLRADGVSVKVLSGDSEPSCRHVCAEVGLDASRVVLGAELERMSDTALAHVAEQTTVFARVSPAQKTRVLRALQGRGHVVGFLGDGINDAPSLHSADVGISVSGAADVAMDASDILLLERDLAVLHAGIVAGRRAFANVLKYLLMATSSNFGNVLGMAAAVTFLPFLPMLPTQILLNNFLYDVAQLTIPTDRVDEQYLTRPRRWDMRLVQRFMVLVGPLSSLFDGLTFLVLLTVFHANEALFHTGWFIESLATQTLVLFVIRTAARPWRSPPGRALAATVVGVVVVGLLLPFTGLGAPLGFERPPAAFYAFLVAAVSAYLGLVETVKRRVLARLSGARA